MLPVEQPANEPLIEFRVKRHSKDFLSMLILWCEAGILPLICELFSISTVFKPRSNPRLFMPGAAGETNYLRLWSIRLSPPQFEMLDLIASLHIPLIKASPVYLKYLMSICAVTLSRD